MAFTLVLFRAFDTRDALVVRSPVSASASVLEREYYILNRERYAYFHNSSSPFPLFFRARIIRRESLMRIYNKIITMTINFAKRLRVYREIESYFCRNIIARIMRKNYIFL